MVMRGRESLFAASNSIGQRLAKEVSISDKCWQMVNGGVYITVVTGIPLQHFRTFWNVGKRYAELTKNDELIHRKVVRAVHGLTDFLSVKRKRIPDSILTDAERLECLLFSGYDPQFEGDEPPGL
jgi:hypothetical protein